MSEQDDGRRRRAAPAGLADELVDVTYAIQLEPEVAFRYISPTVTELVGYTPEEHYDDPELGSRLVDPRDRDALRSAIAAPVDQDLDLTLRWTARDGRLIWTRHRARKRRHADGSVVLYGSVRDVTDLHQAIDRFAAAEHEARLVLDNSADVLIRLGPDLTVLWASPSLAATFGWEPRDVVGARFELAPAEDVDRNTAALAAAIAQRQDRLDVRSRVACGDGSVRWADATMRLVWRVDGELDFVVVNLRDITAQVEAEDARAASEELFRRAIVDAAIGVCLVAPNGRLIEVNPALCQFFGLPAADLLDRRFADLTHPDDVELDEAHLRRILAGEVDDYRVTKRFRHADGSELVADQAVSVIRSRDGSVGHLVAQIMDITQRARAERALAESEEHFRLLAENATDVVVRADLAGTLRWVSHSVTRVAGWLPADLVGRQVADLLPAEHRADAAAALDRARRGESGTFESPVLAADGTPRWFSFTIRPVYDGDVITGWIGGWRDIDREVHARELAAQREAQYQLLAENSADIVLKVDADGRVEWVSPSVTETLGWRVDELVGRRTEDFVHPDDLVRFREEIGAIRQVESGRFSLRLRRPDGAYRWYAENWRRITDHAGQPVARVVGLREIDAELRAVEALALSEMRFRLAMDSAPTGMAVVDLDRRFVEVNQALARMVGRDPKWLTSHRVPDILPDADHSLDLRMRALVLSGRVSSAVQEHRLERADGSTMWVQHSVALLRDESGTPVSYVSQFVDVTETREARRDLEFLAWHDALTRLANRRALVDHMSRILAHRPRAGTRLGVLFLDLDGLKPVNDRMGHAVGDRVIVAVSERIRSSVRAMDLVARFGGDEFVALVPDVTTLSDVRSIGEKIRAVVAEPIVLDDRTLHVTVSVGAALAEYGDDADAVLRKADSAVYRAKAGGGNRIEAYIPAQPTRPGAVEPAE